MSNMETNWIQEMIEREALPKAARTEKVAEFCVRHGISETTYYNHSSREENQKQSLKIALMSVKKRAPEILEKLGDKAEEGDTRAIDMYLKYVLELVDKLDITSKGERVEAFNFISNDSGHKTNNKTGESLEEATG